jgi:hypothetical protein
MQARSPPAVLARRDLGHGQGVADQTGSLASLPCTLHKTCLALLSRHAAHGHRERMVRGHGGAVPLRATAGQPTVPTACRRCWACQQMQRSSCCSARSNAVSMLNFITVCLSYLDLLTLCQFPRLMKYLDFLELCFALLLTPNYKILLFFVQCKHL